MKIAQARMIETVVATIQRYHMLPRGSRVGVAVSGGADSICLLRVLHQLSAEWGWELEVLHLNHKLRGQESEEDADFVAAVAGHLGLRCHVAVDEVRRRGGNLEQAARDARREFFARMRRDEGVDRVATGHTLDDQAETVLFRAVRGAGLRGLQGILPATSEGVVRPLLRVERAAIREWLRQRSIPWREDSTNADLSIARNRLRIEILPMIEAAVNPGGRRALARLAELARDDEQFLEEAVNGAAERLFCQSGGAVVLDCGALQEEAPALRPRLIRRAVEAANPGLRGLEMKHIQQIQVLAAAGGGSGQVSLPGVAVERSFEWLRFSQTRNCDRTNPDVTFMSAGVWQWPQGGSIRVAAMPDVAARLRARRAGDRVRLSGEAGSVRLHDLFQKHRVPRWEREWWPVIECGDVVVWTRRFGLAAGAAEDGWVVTDGTDDER